MHSQIWIWAILQAGRHFKPFVTFLRQMLTNFCGLATHILLLEGPMSFLKSVSGFDVVFDQ